MRLYIKTKTLKLRFFRAVSSLLLITHSYSDYYCKAMTENDCCNNISSISDEDLTRFNDKLLREFSNWKWEESDTYFSSIDFPIQNQEEGITLNCLPEYIKLSAKKNNLETATEATEATTFYKNNIENINSDLYTELFLPIKIKPQTKPPKVSVSGQEVKIEWQLKNNYCYLEEGRLSLNSFVKNFHKGKQDQRFIGCINLPPQEDSDDIEINIEACYLQPNPIINAMAISYDKTLHKVALFFNPKNINDPPIVVKDLVSTSIELKGDYKENYSINRGPLKLEGEQIWICDLKKCLYDIFPESRREEWILANQKFKIKANGLIKDTEFPKIYDGRYEEQNNKAKFENIYIFPNQNKVSGYYKIKSSSIEKTSSYIYCDGRGNYFLSKHMGEIWEDIITQEKIKIEYLIPSGGIKSKKIHTAEGLQKGFHKLDDTSINQCDWKLEGKTETIVTWHPAYFPIGYSANIILNSSIKLDKEKIKEISDSFCEIFKPVLNNVHTQSSDLINACKKENSHNSDILHQFRNHIKNKNNIGDLKTIISYYNQRDNLQKNSVILKGYIIFASDINKVLRENIKIREISIYSFYSFLVDENINAPGLKLSVITDLLYVMGNKIINLVGHEGNDNFSSRLINNNTFDGIDGRPGVPGKNGGHFYISANKLISENIEIAKVLDIQADGGKGGNGENGGNGRNGKDGGNIDLKAQIEKGDYESYLIGREKIKAETFGDYVEKGFKFFLTFNDKFREVYRGYEQGKPGGKAGKGGEGGYGGRPGTVSITLGGRVLTYKPPENGKRGENGVHGAPGKGGKNGPLYEGVYINEFVLPGVRGYQEIDPEITGVKAGTSASFEAATRIAITELAKFASMGLSLAVQGVISPIAAYCSSGWEQEPHIISSEQQYASNGEIPKANDFNNINIKQPSEICKINTEQKISEYNEFKLQFLQSFLPLNLEFQEKIRPIKLRNISSKSQIRINGGQNARKYYSKFNKI